MKRYLVILIVFVASGCDPVSVDEVDGTAAAGSITIDTTEASNDTVNMTTGLGVEPLY